MRNNELEQAKTLQDLNEELMALKLRMAFQAEFEEELADLERAEHDPEFEAMLADAEPRMLRRIDKELRREQLRHTVRTVVPRVSRACAMLLLVFYLGLTVAVATMEPVRVGVVDFIQDITEKYTRFDIEPDEVEIPPEWEGEYFPTYIPKGLEVNEVNRNEVCFGIDNSIVFYEYNGEMATNMDTEGSQGELASINKNTGVITEKNGWIKVVWRYENKYFVIVGSCSKKDLLRMAESIHKI